MINDYAITHALHTQKASTETPIVAITSYALPGDREKAIDAGCTGYIEKPIDPETFVKQMELALVRGGKTAP